MRSILCFLICCGIGHAESLDYLPPMEMPAIVAKAKALRFTETEAELADLAPGAGKPQPSVGEGSTQAEETIELLGNKMRGEYFFQRGILYLWSFTSEAIAPAKGIPLSQAVVAEFERRFGPAVRSFHFPAETDGHDDSMSMGLEWRADHGKLWVTFDFSSVKCRITFGSGSFPEDGNLRVTLDGEKLRAEVITRKSGEHVEHELGGDPECLFVLRELAKRGVTGSLRNEPLRLPDCGQEIGWTGASAADGKTYQVSGITVMFPLSVKRPLPNGTSFSEVHQGMDSLFPEGLSFQGRKLDLKALERWHQEVPKYR